MNKKIQKGREEYDKKNFKKALGHFEGVRKDDKWYDFAVLHSIVCLMNLERYEEALNHLNYLIGKHPYDDCLWFDKVICYDRLDERKKALKALGELERIIDISDKNKLLRVARLYSLLMDDKKALKYCNMALDIDENFRDALLEKSHIVTGLNDEVQMNEVADKLVDVCDGNFIALWPAIKLKLFAENYRGCYDLINDASVDESIKEQIELFKGSIYKNMCETLNAQIICLGHVDVSVDEAIKLMIDFQESGKNHGTIRGVEYYVL